MREALSRSSKKGCLRERFADSLALGSYASSCCHGQRQQKKEKSITGEEKQAKRRKNDEKKTKGEGGGIRKAFGDKPVSTGSWG